MIARDLPEPSLSELRLSPRIRQRGHPGWKYLFDVCVVVLSAPVLVPVLIAVAVYIRLVSPGPVFFVQSRIGLGGNAFWMYKFRTMRVPPVSRDRSHREYLVRHRFGDVPLKKPEYRRELIPGGGLLRKLAIDELPQLLNVLQGNMSLVGPRPDLLRLEDYAEWQLRRFEVLPGITGLWQVSGKNQLTFNEMIELDIQYIETRSLRRDLTILARTLTVLVSTRNQ